MPKGFDQRLNGQTRINGDWSKSEGTVVNPTYNHALNKSFGRWEGGWTDQDANVLTSGHAYAGDRLWAKDLIYNPDRKSFVDDKHVDIL